jgi:hypothetical protein
MDQLRIGDYVRTKKDGYSRVYSFIHIDPHVEVEFLQLYTAAADKPLELTADHMLFTADHKAVAASQIQVGDVLSNQQPVTKIESVKRHGLYAPVTETGDIVVNDVLASCYVALFEDATTLLNQHGAAHAIFSMQRLACGVMPSLCNEETYDEEGFSLFAAPLIHMIRVINHQNALVQVGVMALTMPGIYAMYGMEQLLSAPSGLILVLLGLGYKFWMNKKQNNAMKIKSV